MKKKFVHLFFAALTMFSVVGCQEHEQSELDFGQIQDTAYVTGCITYSLGQDLTAIDSVTSGYVAEVIKPATGRKVYIDVPLSSYQAGAQGNKIFTGVVDEKGNVTIAIPVKSDGISGATMRYEEFTAERSEYLKMVDGQPVFETRMYKFETPAAMASRPTLLPGSNSIGEEAELRYEHTVIDMKAYAETAVFSGKLQLPYEVSYRVGAYKEAANCQVEITIQDGEDVEEMTAAKAPKYTYGGVTNEAGEFAINLPVKNLRKGFHITEAKVVPLNGGEFTHYVNAEGKSVQLAGAYTLRTDWVAGTNIMDVAEVVEGIECSVGECPLKFVPGYNNGIADKVQPDTWNENLAGWVFGEKAFAGMAATAKIQGNIMLAKETGFAVGAYEASKQSVTIKGNTAPYDKEFTVLTNAEGLFELEIPVEQEGVNPGITWTVDMVTPTSIAYTHYQAADKSVVYKEGTYSFYKKSRKVDAEWNELGTYHYKFAPTVEPETWSNNLAGWFVKENYNETATVTANLYLAHETAYAVGAYELAKGRRVSVTVEYSSETATLVAPVQADGKFSITIPVESATSKYTVDNFTLLDAENDDFKHYTQDGNKSIAGKYVQYKKVAAEEGDWNNKWSIYYKFQPTSAPETWKDSNNEMLAGWYVNEDFEETTTVTAKVYVAQETALAIGEYTAAKGLRMSVNVNYGGSSIKLIAPVQADGTLKLTVPVKAATSEYTANEFTLIDNEVEGYKHYTKKGEKTLSGNYALKYKFEDKEGDWNNKYTLYYSFAPATSPLTWHANLAGWYKKEGYDKSATATGKAYFAKEKSYAIGEYVAATNEVITISVAPLGAQLQVPVKNDGSFSVAIPMKDAFDEYTLTANAGDVEVDDFVHYKAQGKTSTLEGKYTAGSPLKSEDAAWNEMGTYYFKFTPTASVPTYTNKLFGWQKFDARYANTDAEVSGTIQMAVETGFWKGGYEPYANEKVIVSYILSGELFEMVVLTNADGQFTCKTYREFGDQHPAVSAVPMKTEVDDFVHYYHVTSPTQMKIAGNYYHYVSINDNAWNNKGTAYYKFNPDGSPAEWPNNNLIGWYKQKDSEGKVNFKLYAQKAIESTESGNHEADWTAAGAGVMATVTLTRTSGGYESKTFDMLVSGQALAISGVPFMQKVEDGVDNFTVSIVLKHSSSLAGYPEVTDFKHYPDPLENAVKSISGKYVGYTFSESEVVTSGVVEIKKSAKLLFQPNTTPDGWSNYDWYSILDHTIDD